MRKRYTAATAIEHEKRTRRNCDKEVRKKEREKAKKQEKKDGK
jgi:hypothetical protein